MLTRLQAQGRTAQAHMNHLKRHSLTNPKSEQGQKKLSDVGKSSSKPSAVTPRKETKVPSLSKSKVSEMTTKPDISKAVEEIELLKKINTDLLQRVNALETELTSTKLSLQVLSSVSHSTQLPLKTTASELPAATSSPAPPAATSTPTPPSATSTPTLPAATPQPPAPLLPAATLQPLATPSFATTDPPPVSTSSAKRRPRVLIYGDSMVRDFGLILQQLLPEYSVHCVTHPGAPLSFVIKDIKDMRTEKLNKHDIVFIMAGTNNIPNLTPADMKKEFLVLSTICQSTNLVFSSIPYKYNVKEQNCNIFSTNQFILKSSYVHNFFYFECNYFLSRQMYTKHGLHLNISGKKSYCVNLSLALLSINGRISNSNRGFLLPNIVNQPSSSRVNLCNNNNNNDEVLLIDISCPPNNIYFSDESIPGLTGDTDSGSNHSSSLFLANV